VKVNYRGGYSVHENRPLGEGQIWGGEDSRGGNTRGNVSQYDREKQDVGATDSRWRKRTRSAGNKHKGDVL